MLGTDGNRRQNFLLPSYCFPPGKVVPGWGCGWLHKPVILVLEILKQEDQEFKASLSYIKSLEASLGYTRLSFKIPNQTITVQGSDQLAGITSEMLVGRPLQKGAFESNLSVEEPSVEPGKDIEAEGTDSAKPEALWLWCLNLPALPRRKGRVMGKRSKANCLLTQKQRNMRAEIPLGMKNGSGGTRVRRGGRTPISRA